MKQQRKLVYLLPMVMLVLFITPTLATTQTIHNDEIYLSYLDDKCSFRYWYKNSDLKQTFVLNSIKELTEDNVQKGILYFDKSKVDTFDLTTTSQQLIYDLDDFQDETYLRHHVVVEINIEFNYIEIELTIIRWDKTTELNSLVLVFTANGVLNELQLESHYYFKRITVLQESDNWNENLELYLGMSNSIFLLILTVLSILNLSILLLHRRH